MVVHLVTGYKGKEHIQSKDARSFNAAMFGSGQFVMEIGEQIEASIINNNTVRVLDGDILMQGAHIRIETDTYEDLTITTGTAGKNRNDLIVMTYEKNNGDGTENAYLEVIKGTESEGTAADPEYISGVLAEGAIKNQMPLYRVKLEGVVLSDIEALFTTIPTYKTLAEKYAAQFQEACNTYLGMLNILDTREEIEANTQENQLAGALGVKEISTELEQLSSNLTFPSGNGFYVDEKDGVPGYNTDPQRGADTFHPFKSGFEGICTVVDGYKSWSDSSDRYDWQRTFTYTAEEDCFIIINSFGQGNSQSINTTSVSNGAKIINSNVDYKYSMTTYYCYVYCPKGSTVSHYFYCLNYSHGGWCYLSKLN